MYVNVTYNQNFGEASFKSSSSGKDPVLYNKGYVRIATLDKDVYLNLVVHKGPELDCNDEHIIFSMKPELAVALRDALDKIYPKECLNNRFEERKDF